MYKTIVVVFVCLCCLLTSCRTSRQEIQKSTTLTENIINQKETYRDTTLFTPKSQTKLKVYATELVFKSDLNGVSKPKTFTQKNGNATAKLEVQPDGVTVTATCDSLAIVAKIKKELYSETRHTALSNVENNKVKTGFSLYDLLKAFVVGLLVGGIVIFILKTLKIV